MSMSNKQINKFYLLGSTTIALLIPVQDNKMENDNTINLLMQIDVTFLVYVYSSIFFVWAVSGYLIMVFL